MLWQEHYSGILMHGKTIFIGKAMIKNLETDKSTY